MRQGNEPTQWPHALLQMVQDCLVWVNVGTWEDWCGTSPPTYEEWEAEGWGEHGTSIVNHCLYFELGRLEEVESLASPSNSTCPLPQPNRQIGPHLLRMASEEVASQVQDFLWVGPWPKCHLRGWFPENIPWLTCWRKQRQLWGQLCAGRLIGLHCKNKFFLPLKTPISHP